MLKKSWGKAVLICLMVLVAAVIVFLAFRLDSAGTIQGEGSSPTREMNEPEYLNIRYNGRNYTFNSNLKTVLFIGVDDFGAVKSSEVYLNNGQADFLMLAIIDTSESSYCLLHINRDTMTQVPVLGLQGKEAGSELMQIALAHTYGTGLEDSCENTVRAVSDLLSGIGVDYYIAMNMDGVAVLNDAVGGVDVEVLDTFADIPEFVKGETVHLSGDLALSYIRGRMDTDEGTNTSRMERQRQYIEAFLEKYNQMDAGNGLIDTYEQIGEYVVTNMSVNVLSDFSEMLQEYCFDDVLTIKGTARTGEEFVEFTYDEKALARQVVELFYLPA